MLTHPTYRTTETSSGADLNYDCPCGCVAGFAYVTGVERAPESCCCGRTMLAGTGARQRLSKALPLGGEYELETQFISLPSGAPLEVSLATPSHPSH